MKYKCTAGELRTRITFQQPTLVTDPGGAQSAGWADVATDATVWARWIYDHGQEVVNSGAEVATQRATVTVRYRADVQTAWRVVKDGQYWQVFSIDQVQDRNRWTELRVERVTGTVANAS